MKTPIDRRGVTSRCYGSKNSGSQQWWAKARTKAATARAAITNRFILAKQQLCTCITLFCTFLSGRCTNATWNFLISRTRSMELVNTAQNFSFSFSKLRYGPFGFNPRESRQHLTNWMKLNKIDEVWNSANSFSKRHFWFVVIQKFCYRGNVTYRLLLYTHWEILTKKLCRKFSYRN